jgi:hypothetical protein
MGARLALAVLLAVAAPQAGSVPKPSRLFSDDQPIHVTIKGPIAAVVATPANARTARPATLQAGAETLPILLSPRGILRRTKVACSFPPLGVQFTTKPAKESLFAKQKRLKLVTHCRSVSQHQQYVLLEYAAYRMFNVLSSLGLRARLGTFDYVEQNGRPVTSRVGFFIEDSDDAAKRNGQVELRIMARIAPSQLEAATAARAALFEYMIGNTDWSMRAGPAGDACCHNFRLFGKAAGAQYGIVFVPYDFDVSGLVNPPYALPPEGLGLDTVRQRRYRGYCIHNAQALAVAAEFRAKRAGLIGVLGTVPGLDNDRRQKASAYLASFFEDIATDESVTKKLLKTCIR